MAKGQLDQPHEKKSGSRSAETRHSLDPAKTLELDELHEKKSGSRNADTHHSLPTLKVLERALNFRLPVEKVPKDPAKLAEFMDAAVNRLEKSSSFDIEVRETGWVSIKDFKDLISNNLEEMNVPTDIASFLALIAYEHHDHPDAPPFDEGLARYLSVVLASAAGVAFRRAASGRNNDGNTGKIAAATREAARLAKLPEPTKINRWSDYNGADDALTFLENEWGKLIRAQIAYRDDIERLGDRELVRAVRGRHTYLKSAGMLTDANRDLNKVMPPAAQRVIDALARCAPDSAEAEHYRQVLAKREAVAASRKRDAPKPS